MADIPFSCSCGTVKGMVLDASAATGNHVRCHCASCRAAVLFSTGTDGGETGVVLYQTTPDKIRFSEGLSQISAFSFDPKKLLRFRASCCGVQMFTTLPTPRFAFVGVMANCLSDTSAIGPVAIEAFVPDQNGKSRHSSVWRLYGFTTWRALKSVISGRWRQTPFFDVTTGQPVTDVYIPTKQERANLPL